MNEIVTSNDAVAELRSAAYRMRTVGQTIARGVKIGTPRPVRVAEAAAFALALQWVDIANLHAENTESGGCEWCGELSWPCTEVQGTLNVARCDMPALLAGGESTWTAIDPMSFTSPVQRAAARDINRGDERGESS